MRHRRKVNHLGRTSSHRKAMLANMAASLIIHKKITTTTAKAKALRVYVEPLLTKSKEDSTHSRRVVFNYLQNKDAVSELFREISPKIINRPGGYTRILKIGNRVGDSADMSIIELVDYNESLLAAKSGESAKTGRRRRRGSKKKGEEVTHASDHKHAEVTPSESETEVKQEEDQVAEASVEDQAVQSEPVAETSTEESAPAENEVEAKSTPDEVKADDEGSVEGKQNNDTEEEKKE